MTFNDGYARTGVILGGLLGALGGGAIGRFFPKVASLIDIPWQTAVGEDYRFPETVGKRPLGTDLINGYVSMVHRATQRDPAVGKAFLLVMNMLKPPTSLMSPSMLLRVLRSNLALRRERAGKTAAALSPGQ